MKSSSYEEGCCQKSPHHIKVILFDWDGTLVDSLPVLFQSYLTFLREYGLKGSWKEFEKLNGPSLPEIIRFLKKKHSLSASVHKLYSRYRCILKQELSSVRLIPRALQVLSSLNQNGFRLGIVTSSSRDMVRSAKAFQKISNYIEHTICSGPRSVGKPDPSLYGMALRKFAISPEQTLAIEDSQNGIRAALSARINVVWFHHFSNKLHANVMRKNERKFLGEISSLQELFPFLRKRSYLKT